MLLIVATPIGNLEDISFRALKALREADVILAEDTRHTGLLLKHFDIPHKPFISFYDEVENRKLDDIIALVKSDQKVVLVSDAGTPLISDPGFKLIREAVKQEAVIQSIPGPSAVITALAASGLPTDKFLFLGYPPKKPGHRIAFFEKTKKAVEKLPATVIFYEAPHKIVKTLNDLSAVFGDIEIVIAREMTKVYEKFLRGKISEILKTPDLERGEMTVLFRPIVQEVPREDSGRSSAGEFPAPEV